MKKYNVCAFLLLCLALLLPLGVSAQSAAELEMNRLGSVSVTLKTSDGKPVSGSRLELIQVAALELDDGNMTYAPVNGFETASISLDAESLRSAATAKKIAAAVPATAVGQEKATDKHGKATFEDLPLGLYLVRQKTAAAGYTAIDPFLVTLPGSEDGQWRYDIDATPKTGAVKPDATTTPTTKPTTGGRLPQTGQLLWPVPVLAAGGIVFFLTGWLLTRKQERNEKDPR